MGKQQNAIHDCIRNQTDMFTFSECSVLLTGSGIDSVPVKRETLTLSVICLYVFQSRSVLLSITQPLSDWITYTDLYSALVWRQCRPNLRLLFFRR